MGQGVVAPDPRELLDVAVLVARQAGTLARSCRERGIGDVGTKSSPTDLVTAADRAVERLIATMLREHRPGDAMIGEEYGTGLADGPTRGDSAPHGTRQPGAGSVRWVVDPIDGTVNYVYGIPLYAVSIAAQVDGATVAAVVHNPASGEEWTATRGGGAWRDGRRLTCSRVEELGQCLVATGFGYDPARRTRQARVIAQVLPQIRDIRRLGAASLDLCFVAEGRVDAFFEQGLYEWDLAGGGLVAAEAGVRVDGLRGRGPGPQMVLAASPRLFPRLHDVLVAVEADREA